MQCMHPVFVSPNSNLFLSSAPAWKIEEDAKKSDHVRGKKGKMKKMKEKYKDQVQLITISHSMLFEIFCHEFFFRMMRRGN